MMLDSSTRRNLELCETLREKQKERFPLWVLDKTKTAMGARTLRKYIEQPLIEKKRDFAATGCSTKELKESGINREEIREYLSPVYDLEKLMTRITYGTANPKILTAFAGSFAMLPSILYLLRDMKQVLLKETAQELDPLEDVYTCTAGNRRGTADRYERREYHP